MFHICQNSGQVPYKTTDFFKCNVLYVTFYGWRNKGFAGIRILTIFQRGSKTQTPCCFTAFLHPCLKFCECLTLLVTQAYPDKHLFDKLTNRLNVVRSKT